jgi:hypothetical protein
VHAGVVGNITAVYGYIPRHYDMPETSIVHPSNWMDAHKSGTPITYNPYRRSTFFMTEIGYSVYAADAVSFLINDVRAMGWIETNEYAPSLDAST